MDYLRDFLLIFVPLFVVLDPAGSIPVYLAITDRYSGEQRRMIARRATFVAAVVGVVFVIVGQSLFRFLGVTVEDFQIAGGMLLLVLAVIDLLIPGKPAVSEKPMVTLDASVGIVPLAVPLIMGPATMTTSLVMVNTYTRKYEAIFGPDFGVVIVVTMVCLALLANLAILFLGMWYSEWLVKLVGRNAMTVVNKIVMILLAAIAVSLIRRGVVSIVHAGQ